MVTAILVTYNSSSFLQKAVEGLINQTAKVDHIIIVDNASSVEHKEAIKKIEKEYTRVHVLYLKENTGGAGGFEAGMKFARDTYDPEWYWIMDDDACPQYNCLEELLKASENLENVGFVAPLIYGMQKEKYQLYHHKYSKKLLLKEKMVSEEAVSANQYLKIDADAFVGPMFSKKSVKSLGVADGKLFIYGDDTEYTYRITRNYNGYLVTNAVINHRDVMNTDTSSANWWWKEYYMYRNRFLFINKYQKPILKPVSTVLLIMTVLKKILAALTKKQYKGLRLFRVALLFRSMRDGLSNKSGALLKPADYFKDLNLRKAN